MAAEEALNLQALEPEFLHNPYPTYARLRESGPRRVVHYGVPAWIVTRYQDVRSALADARLSSDARRASAAARQAAPWLGADIESEMGRHMLFSDPPDHTRLRSLVSRIFTPARVDALAPRIQDTVDELMAAFLPRGHVDLVTEFAIPLPGMVIMDLLGVPGEDVQAFRGWSDVAIGDDPSRSAAAYASLRVYLSQLIARRRAEGGLGEDLLGQLIAISDEGEQLDDRELHSTAFLLLAAGASTVADLLGSGVLHLLRHPEQLAAVRKDRSLLEPAIEELIRYDGPAFIAPMRFTTEPVEIGGVTIPGGGEVVMLCLAGANHDPERYADGESFDIKHRTAGHLGFGHGPHFCLGAPLARLETRIALSSLLDRCPELALDVSLDQLERRRNPLARGLTHLPLRFTPTG